MSLRVVTSVSGNKRRCRVHRHGAVSQISIALTPSASPVCVISWYLSPFSISAFHHHPRPLSRSVLALPLNSACLSITTLFKILLSDVYRTQMAQAGPDTGVSRPAKRQKKDNGSGHVRRKSEDTDTPSPPGPIDHIFITEDVTAKKPGKKVRSLVALVQMRVSH
jgi:hypothetical protein